MRKNSLKATVFLTVVVLVSAAALWSCHKDVDDAVFNANIRIIQFSTATAFVTEGGEVSIEMILDKPALQNGSIDVSLETSAVYKKDYSTDPPVNHNTITIPVTTGQLSAKIKISTHDNSLLEINKTIRFTIASTSAGLKIGTHHVFTLTINDDEGASFVNFAANKGTVAETDSTGIVVTIPLSVPAKGNGTLTIALPTNIEYGSVLTTSPPAVSHTITLNVAEHDTIAHFVVFPINNDLFSDNLIIPFQISTATGVTQKGSSLNYDLTILDDELPSTVNFKISTDSIAENSPNGIIVRLSLSSPAKGGGSIQLKLTPHGAAYGFTFTTSPVSINNYLTLNLAQNDTSAQFTILPIDNNSLTGNPYSVLSIEAVGGVARKGVNTTFSLKFIDDETANYANFVSTSGTIDETNSNGIVAEIQLLTPASTAGQLYVLLDYAWYGSDMYSQNRYGTAFTTLPAAEDFGYSGLRALTLDILPGATTTSFKIIPIDNSQCVDKQARFLISYGYGTLLPGNASEYVLTVNGSQSPVAATLVQTSGSIAENSSSGNPIQLTLSGPSPKNGSITARGPENSYGSTYYTTPGMSSQGYYDFYSTVPVSKGAATVEFNAFPINNATPNSNQNVVFHVSGSECIQIDSYYSLTITDDD